MKKRTITLMMICVLQVLLWNCTRTEDLPTVSTSEVTEITTTTATAGGSILANGANVTVRGVCYSSTNPNPTIDDLHTTDGSGTGDFVSRLEGLLPNTTYHVKAYAMNSASVAYGGTVTFTTLPEPDPDTVLTPTERLCRPNGWRLADTHIEPVYEMPDHTFISNLLDGYLWNYEIDDVLVFNADGTHYVNPGALTNPNGYTTTTSLGAWYYDNADNPQFITMRIPYLYNKPAIQCRIGTLSNSEFTIAYTFVDEDRAQYTVALRYVPAN